MKALAQNTLIQNRYLVVQLIGKGGMGEVYLAVDQRLGSAIALKRTFFAGDEMLANAFEREAKTLARMRHPVLPKVSDHFGEGDEQYLVMEHISGDDLAKRIEIAQKPFPVSWVLFWADQLLDALSYLHSHEPPIIHRDIKPQNLKLTDENHIILLDFGLSKTSTGQTNVNQSGGSTGSVVGYTPHYAPMEQIRGIGTSARSDLYSLSATLYQLLTDTVPSDALSRADSMLNGLPDPIQPIFEINPEISKNVSDVILKGMEVSQDRRYANAREMQKILRKAFAEMQQGVTADTAVQDRPTTSIEQPLSSSFAQTEVLNAGQSGELGSASSSPVFGGFSGNSVGSETDFDATIAYDPGSEVVSPKQADVKTEVFLAGSLPFPLSPDQDSTSLNGPPQPGQNSSLSGLSATNDFSSGFDSGSKGYTPDATAPYLPVQGDDANGFPDEGLGTPDYYGNSTSQPGAFQTVSTPYFDTPVPEIEPEPEVSSPSRDAVVSLPAKKKSSSKVFAVVGGLSALLILGTFAALGGWYYLSNYNAAQTVAEPTPSPEMSIEASPSPEPTLETVFDSNSLGNSNSDPTAETNTNSDVGGDEFTVAPTPAPVITGPATRSTPQTATRSTPPTTVRNNAPRPVPPAAKATPKPKPKSADDRTKILQ